MDFMKKNVNFVLLFLIVASLVLFTGFAVYYQTVLKDITLEYNDKLGELQKVTSELGFQKQALNETYELRVKAERDKSALDSKYKDLSGENIQLEKDNTNLRVEVSQTKSNLAAAETDLENKNVQLAQAQADLASANNEISSKNSRISNLKDDIDEICVYLASQGLTHNEC